MATATKKTTSAAARGTSNDTIGKLRKDTAALAKRDRSVAESWLNLALRIRDNFNVSDKTVRAAVRDAVLAGCKQFLAEKSAKNRTSEVMCIATAAKLPKADEAPANLQHYAKAVREANPKPGRATGGKAGSKGSKGKMLHASDVAKQFEGVIKGMQKRPATPEATELLRSVEDTLLTVMEALAAEKGDSEKAAASK